MKPLSPPHLLAYKICEITKPHSHTVATPHPPTLAQMRVHLSSDTQCEPIPTQKL